MVINYSKRGVEMGYDFFYEKIKKHMENYKIKVLGIVENGTWQGKEKAHILPYSENNMLKQFLPEAQPDYLLWGIPKRNEKIKLHMYASHLNSSQVMCINYFAPFLHDEAKQKELMCILKEMGLKKLDLNSRIVEASFEKVVESSKTEGTNFDFYIKFNNGQQVFFEIKYTEKGFGGLSEEEGYPMKYVNKWNNIYKKHIADSKFCKKFCSINATIEKYKEIPFYKHYQIWRNISYIKNDNDKVVFLTFKQNPITEKHLNETLSKLDLDYSNNIFRINWEELIELTLDKTKGTSLEEHYQEFNRKYIDIDFKK